ncbi:hypothetical protein H310_11734 [Aphanomyces invadans]|uniref:Uncharacterized protein n=1 Tax=Aphanomyces invadans TaxID=157072 RepID=A0A024TL64_9STRA|nr:hypothetical protein H310_11734 [Aphanomyces invadans]ETV94778.1 hypothetical protein H310_11734 [Aphanomyces invadans]|eukprot:XP_008876723.1 hypothetical protein H310_11734 [Aphanomyces invadans]
MASTPKQVYTDMEAPPMAVPVAPLTLGEWKVPVTRATTNLSTDCCPCVVLADTMSRIITHGYVYGGMLTFFYTIAFTLPATLFFMYKRSSWDWVAVCVGSLMLAAMVVAVARFKVRSYFGIPGNLFDDCFFACFCMPYTIGQMKAQVEDIPVAVSTLPGYEA